MADATLEVRDAQGEVRDLAADETEGVLTPKHIVAGSALPSGAATEEKQDVGNESLDDVASSVAELAALISAGALKVMIVSGDIEESLWTDDTETYFVRHLNAGVITWTDVGGNASAAPGTGARPADTVAGVVDRSPYQVTTAFTGASIGDLVDHFVITNPVTGAIIGHFWINSTTEAKLAAAPSAANITPLAPAPLVLGATSDAVYADATGAAAGTLAAVLKGIFVKLAGVLSVTSPAPTTSTATIADGASLSDAIVLDGKLPGGFYIPASFEGGYIQFQRSWDAVNFVDVCDEFGNKYQITAGSSTYIKLPSPAEWIAAKAMKIRSVNSAGVASPQSGAAAIVVPLQA